MFHRFRRAVLFAAVILLPFGAACGGISITDGGSAQLSATLVSRVEVAPDVWEVRLLQGCPSNVRIDGIPENGVITTVVKLLEMRSTNPITVSFQSLLRRVERVRPAQPTDPDPFSNVGVFSINQMNVEGDIGPETPSPSFFIEAHNIHTIETGDSGRLTGGVRVLPYPGINESNIFTVQIGGDILAPIHNPRGSVFKSIQSRFGSMIGSQVPGLLDVSVATFVGGIRVAQDLDNVKIGDVAAPQFSISHSTTFAISGIEVGRDFTGTIAVGEAERIKVGRNFAGRYLVLSTASTGTGPSEYITIGNNLESTGLIELPAQGLREQVYINANLRNNQSPPSAGRWIGTIKVGETVLTSNSQFPPSLLDGQYANSTASLGGGSVAVLPARLKGTESVLRFKMATGAPVLLTEDPLQVNVTVNKPFAGIDVLERVNADWVFYGRSRVNAVGGCSVPSEGLENAVRVFQRPFEPPVEGQAPEPWVEITHKIGARFFNTGLDGSSNPNQRVIEMRGSQSSPIDLPAPYSDLAYQFTNGSLVEFEVSTTDMGGTTCDTVRTPLLDAGAASAFPQQASDRFTVLIGNTCPTDFNGDGTHDTADLTVLLGRLGNTAATITTGLVGDVNNDGAVNTLDLTKFLAKFGQACIPPAGGALMADDGSQGGLSSEKRASAAGQSNTAMNSSMPTPPGPVLAALGFSSAEAFQSYVDTLSDAELKVYLVLVLQVAQSLEAPTP